MTLVNYLIIQIVLWYFIKLFNLELAPEIGMNLLAKKSIEGHLVATAGSKHSLVSYYSACRVMQPV